MGKIPGDIFTPVRGAGLKGSHITKTVRGQEVVTRWPRPRGRAKTSKQQQLQDDFAAATVIMKVMDSMIQWFALEVSKVGPLMPRDILMWQLYGRPYTFIMPDGRKVYPVAAMQDASELLDSIYQLPSGILVRGATLWQGLPVGDPGLVLTIQPDLSLGWSPGSVPVNPQAFLQVPPIRADIGSSGFGANAFAGRPALPTSDTTCNGIRLWVTNPGSGNQILGGLYEADPTNHSLSGATLIAQSTAQTLVAGLNDMAFGSPQLMHVNTWYFYGFAILGSGTVNFAPAPGGLAGSYFGQSTSTLPNPQPGGVAQFFGDNVGCWAY